MVGTVTVGAAYPALYAVATHAVIGPRVLPDAYVDVPYHVCLSVIGLPWTEPTTWRLVSPVPLPECLSFNSTTACVEGTPMQVGTHTIVVEATDAIGRVITRTYTLTVRPTP